jgi:iron(III) transport system ATP-binding protein
MLTIDTLVKHYDTGSHHTETDAQAQANGVHGVSFDVADGELFTLLGPSGCGKTTTLRSVAGLEQPDSGRIVLGDTVLFDGARRINRPVNRRGLAMVFQNYAIWPHMSVYGNVEFPLRITPRRLRPAARVVRERVERALDTVGLSGFADRNATALSGGQQQRLALARSLVVEPSVLLLDEPLSNLDAKLRENMRIELKRLQRDMGLTAVYVTHDQAEALSMSSRIVIMEKGRIAQIGTPREIYGAPNNRFVADFLGAANFLDGSVSEVTDGRATVQTDVGRFVVVDDAASVGDAVTLCLRMEHLGVVTSGRPAGAVNVLEGKLRAAAFLGDRVDHIFECGGHELRTRSNADTQVRRDAVVSLTIAPEDIVVLHS